MARLGATASPTLEIKWLAANGTVLAAADPRAAADKYRRAAAGAAAALGTSSPLYVQARSQLVAAERGLVPPQAHVAAAAKLVELHVQVYGEHHPETARARADLGEALLYLGRGDDAIGALHRAIADLSGAFGGEDATVADARTRLAGALELVGRFDDAIAENERALAIRRRRFPPNNPFIIESIVQRGRLQGALGRWPAAIETLTQGRALTVASLGPEHLGVAEVDKDLGFAYGHVANLAEAEARYRHALAIEEAALGAASPALAGPLRQLGTVLMMAHREHDAIAPLERALAILSAGGARNPLDLADVRLELAHALARTDCARARGLARAARDVYATEQAAGPRDEAAALQATLRGCAR